jgi:hypothetical protein
MPIIGMYYSIPTFPHVKQGYHAGGTHTKDKLAIYKAILDRWSGGDSSPTYLEPKPLKPKI